MIERLPCGVVGRRISCLGGLLALLAPAAGVSGQTDFFNTDRGRPVQIEDAYPVERFAFELQLAPVRLERLSGGIYNWSIEPELAYGLLPRTQIEVGFPFTIEDARGQGSSSLAGVEFSLLHNLNAETLAVPALALGLDLLLPVGDDASGLAFGTVRGLLTRSTTFARFHLNAQYTVGEASTAGREALAGADVSRWLAGLAIDRTMPLRSMLLIADVYTRQLLDDTQDLEWNAGAGLRYQLNPRFALDAGVGRRLTGEDRGWFVTFGTAYAFAVRSLIPIPRS